MGSISDEERRARQREYTRRYRERNLEKVRERDRQRVRSDAEKARRREKAKEWRAKNPDYLSQYDVARKEFRETLLARMLADQDGKCAICGTTEPPHGWHIDHDHKCCKAKRSYDRCGNCERGVLCGPCNQAIGLFKEDPARFRAAAEYLR
jgi:hypothetical protein